MLRLKPQQTHQLCQNKKREKENLRAQSQEPSRLFHIPTTSLQRNTARMNSTYGKQGPPLYSSARLKQLCHSWPSSPQILQRRHFQNSDFFSIWIWMRSMHSQFLFLFLGFAFVVFCSVQRLFAPFVFFIISVVWTQKLLLFLIKPSYLHMQPPSVTARHLTTLTLLQLRWLYSMQTIVEGGGKYVFHMVFSERQKTKQWFLEKCFSLRKQMPFFVG